VVRTTTVTAGAWGTLADFDVLVGQVVTVGQTVAQVSPPTFSVVAPLDPAQQYRLIQRPSEAQVSITGGPAEFTCTGLAVTAQVSSQNAETSSPPSVRCAVPEDVLVFAGLKAKLTIIGAVAENVLVLPLTAVEGSAESGIVHIVSADGSTSERPVTLGLSDGNKVEITSGVELGEMVLQFVPGADADPQDDIFAGNGGVVIMGMGG